MMRLLLDGGLFANKQPLERMIFLTTAALPMVYGLAWITFRLVEKPGIALGKRLLCIAEKPVTAANSNVLT